MEDGVIKKAKLNERRSVSSEREPGVFTINTGIYSFNRKIFKYINDEQFLPDVLSNMINNGEVINTLETKGTWLDVSYPWDIIRLNASVLRNIKECISCTVKNSVSIRGNVSLGENTVIRSNSYLKGPVVIGCGCDIGPNVCILPSTSIGDNVCISPFTEIRNSVIGNDVIIGSGSIIQDSVIDRGCIIKGAFAAISDEAEIKIDDEYHNVNTGAMLGEGCRLGSHIVARPGVIVGRNSQIKAMNTISGNLPDKSTVI